MKIDFAVSALLATIAAASPTRVLDKRETTWCENWGEIETGGFKIYHNNWGAAQATSGSQCTTFKSVSAEGSVAWSTTWSWAGGSSSVKSYANVALEKVGKQLSAIGSIPSTWDWTYKGKDIVANVAYDLWLAPSAYGKNEYEIMIWLAALGGAGPLSYTGSAVDKATIAGSEWSVYNGTNGEVKVISFVAASEINKFSGDLNEFFTYLTEKQGISSSMYATSLQAGSEPFTGSDAVLDVTGYTISVKSGSSGSASSAAPVSQPTETPSANPASEVSPTAPATLETTPAPVASATSALVVPSDIASEVEAEPAASETSAPSSPDETSAVVAPSKTEAASVPSKTSSPKPGKGNCAKKRKRAARRV